MSKRFYVLAAVALLILIIFGESARKTIKHPTRHILKDFSGIEVNENQFKIDILHYDLKLDLIPEEKKLKGDITITGIIKEPSLEKIYLNFYDNMKILRVQLNQKDASYEREKRYLVINEKVTSDTFTINIKYEGTPKRAGLSGFVFGEYNGSSVIYNLNEPNFASTWFPCNDIPSDKAYFDVYLTNDSSKTSVSNGTLSEVNINGTRKSYHWKTLYPIATYLVCVYSADYVKVSDQYISSAGKDTMPLEYYLFKKHVDQGKEDLKDHPKYLAFFAKTFGEYPFIKEKYGVAEFLWQLGAMEHQTITGIGSNFINGRGFFSDVYVHELAHHWWGNAVTPLVWNDIWLNEGFSTYSEALYSESYAGFTALQSTMKSKFDDDFRGILYQPGDNLFSSTVYDKGAWVLHMLRWEVGDSAFFPILKSYYERYKYKNASTENFRSICETISGKNLKKFFDQWIYHGEGSINAEYSWSETSSESGMTVKFNIQQVQKKYETFHFPLVVKFTTENGEIIKKVFYIDDKKESFEFYSASEIKKVDLDPDGWLLATFSEL